MRTAATLALCVLLSFAQGTLAQMTAGDPPAPAAPRATLAAAPANPQEQRPQAATGPAAVARPTPANSSAPPGSATSDGSTVSISVREGKLAEVFEMLSRTERVNILLGKGVTGQVSVNLYGVTIDQAVRAIADAAGYVAELRGAAYMILDRKEAGMDAVNANTRVRSFRVQYSNTKIVADILTKHLSRYGKITPLLERGLIVVEDQPDFIRRIETLLAEIDRQPRQIMIEAKILEIKLDREEKFGIDWSKVITSQGTTIEGGTRGLADRAGSGLFFSIVGNRLDLFLSALSAKGRVQTLSTPKLLALENQEASTVIGERTGYRVTTTINQVTTESIQFLESGVILKVVPAIDESGRILMRIHPEVSTARVTNNIPSKDSTEVSTQLVAEDGQAIFIGGLIKNSATFRRSGVPVLSDMPFIGRAFGRDEELLSLTETVIIITPRIVTNGAPVPAAWTSDIENNLRRRTDNLDGHLREQAKDAAQPGK